jgi:anion-transporting  ArsA/GET3 family ATPase
LSSLLLPSLLQRRLLIVTGKGGTGKTSVVAALGLAAARAGRRVLLVETGRDEVLPRLLGPLAAPAGYAGREHRPGLTSMRMDPYEALTEYLGLQLGVPRLVRGVLGNRGFRQFLDAAPGWRELITLGKVWHLEQQTGAGGERLHDLLVIDAPATGHGLTLLDVPRVVAAAVRAGPLRRNAERVEAMLRDPAATVLLPVALPEELPARETAELVARVRDEIGIPIDRVIVNAMPDRPFPEGLEDLDQLLAAARTDAAIPGLPDVSVVARCAHHLAERYELASEFLARIGEWTALPTIALPHFPGGIESPEQLEALGSGLIADETGAGR